MSNFGISYTLRARLDAAKAKALKNAEIRARQLVTYPNAAESYLAQWPLDWRGAALEAARRRYARNGSTACVQSDGKIFVELSRLGLRIVGNVPAEPGSRNGYFSKPSDSRAHGWFTNYDGMSSKDGDGLMWGIVIQLPAKRGKAQFVAGYVIGGDGMEGATLDFRNVFEGERDANDSYGRSPDSDAAREAARAADAMAQSAAEREREYQNAWRAGSDASEALGEFLGYRAEYYRLNTERRAALRKGAADMFPAICKTMAGKLESLAETMAELREKIAGLIEGDWKGERRDGSDAVYWSRRDKSQLEAFQEGFGRALPRDGLGSLIGRKVTA